MNKLKELWGKVLKVLPTVSSITMIIAYAPQLMLTYTTHNVTGQSTAFWALLSVTTFGFLMRELSVIRTEQGSWSGLISQLLNFTGTFAMLVACLIFR